MTDLWDESGNVMVEFIAVVVVLLLPLIYFAQSVVLVAKTNTAVQSASQLAAREFVVSPNDALARVRSRKAAIAVLSDAQFPTSKARVTFVCDADPCLTASREVSVAVSVPIATPAFGPFPSHSLVITATHSETVDEVRN